MNKRDFLGKMVRDKITGFTGLVTAEVNYLTGCDQLEVLPRCKEDKLEEMPSSVWIDVNRAKVLDGDAITLNTENEKGAMSRPTRQTPPNS